jgi:hypothetical protein
MPGQGIRLRSALVLQRYWRRRRVLRGSFER